MWRFLCLSFVWGPIFVRDLIFMWGLIFVSSPIFVRSVSFVWSLIFVRASVWSMIAVWSLIFMLLVRGVLVECSSSSAYLRNLFFERGQIFVWSLLSVSMQVFVWGLIVAWSLLFVWGAILARVSVWSLVFARSRRPRPRVKGGERLELRREKKHRHS
ncbi:unnamed protein product [Prorocentrum cordatum]|uniref:Transmembrane protein n=1 Tax=Prorocentrum cordatum TaxID=2364126 RepID=A0ABN9V9S9_9DINO|nr:unnamed protein product [Polarella glacialis]